MQIDHDPKELPRKAIKFVAVFTAVACLTVAVPLSMGLRWAVYKLPDQFVMLLCGSIIGLSAGFFIGRWEALRGLYPQRSVSHRKTDYLGTARWFASLLIRAPFAVFLLPISVWGKSRDDSEGVVTRLTNGLAALVFGAAISLISILAIAIPIMLLTEAI